MVSRFHILLASAALCGFTLDETPPLRDTNRQSPQADIAEASAEWHQLLTKAENALQNKQFDEAARHMQRAIGLAERQGFNDERLASVLAKLGWLRTQGGQAAEGERLLERAAALYSRCGDNCTLQTARTLRHLGAALRLQGQFTSAEHAIRQGLSRIQSHSNAAADRAQLLEELGWIHMHRNQPHAAAAHLSRGIEALANSRFDRDLMAQLYQSLATAYILADKRADAEQACYRALELVDTKTSPQIAAAIYQRLGRIFTELSRHDSAEAHLKRALDLVSNAPGTSAFDLWPVYHEMATLEQRRGNYALAEEHFMQALRLAETVMNRSHPELLKLRANYSVLLRKQDRHKEAARIEAELRSLWSGRNARETDSHTVDARDIENAEKHRGRGSR